MNYDGNQGSQDLNERLGKLENMLELVLAYQYRNCRFLSLGGYCDHKDNPCPLCLEVKQLMSW